MKSVKACHYIIATGIGLGLIFAGVVKAQQPPNPGTPPPPPPSPKEVFNKINPFKKNKKATTADDKKTAKVDSSVKPATPTAPPPPPANPLDLFKKNKKTDDKKPPVR